MDGSARKDERNSWWQQLAGPYQLIAALAVVLVVASFFGIKHGRPAVLRRTSPKQCQMEFQGYISSDWEQFYLENAETLFAAGLCNSMMQNVSLIDTWLTDIGRTWDEERPISDAVLAPLRSTAVWSQLEYRDSCSGITFTQPIEPLVGLMRHPYAHQKCRPSAKQGYRDNKIDWRHDTVFTGMDPETGHFSPAFRKNKSKVHLAFMRNVVRHIETKGHQLLAPLTPAQMLRYYPGRRYLFDLGTGTYRSGSLPWFQKWYGHRHIEFDEIWGWEVTKILPEAYWEEWPPAEAHKMDFPKCHADTEKLLDYNCLDPMHFTNLPCATDPDDPQNPLNIVRAIYQPGDFIAFKLDIDNPEIEHRLMDQMDDELVGMIAEFMFEEHYDSPEMEAFFGKNLNVSWGSAISEFHRWRTKGLRLHYWP